MRIESPWVFEAPIRCSRAQTRSAFIILQETCPASSGRQRHLYTRPVIGVLLMTDSHPAALKVLHQSLIGISIVAYGSSIRVGAEEDQERQMCP